MYRSKAQPSQIRYLLLPFLVLATVARDDDAVLRGRVMRVTDGDTATIRLESGAITVRLYGIDAPERDQPHGKDAASGV